MVYIKDIMSVTVSVLMSVYNEEKYVEKSIKSILNQSYKHFEFVIVNDGSTDGTKEVISQIEDERVRKLENNKNIGLTKSLNKGIRESKGKYIARIDADDIAHKKRLQYQVEFMENNKRVGLLGSYYYIIDSEENILKKVKAPTRNSVLKEKLATSGTPFRHSSVMIRRQALDSVGLYNEDFNEGQDYELFVRVADEYIVKIIPKYLCYARIRGDSITSRRTTIKNQVLHFKLRSFAQRKFNYPFYYNFINIWSLVKGVTRGYIKSILKYWV